MYTLLVHLIQYFIAISRVPDPLEICRDEIEEDVFFGDVTNKEAKKVKKYGSRKTAVYVPGFRMDRRLMRYTMGPQEVLANGTAPCGEESIQEETGIAGTEDSDEDTNGNAKSENCCQLIETEIIDGQSKDKDLDGISQGIESVCISEGSKDVSLHSKQEPVVAGAANIQAEGSSEGISETKVKKADENSKEEETIITQIENLDLNGARDNENNLKDSSGVGAVKCEARQDFNVCEKDLIRELPADDASVSNPKVQCSHEKTSTDECTKVTDTATDCDHNELSDAISQPSIEGEVNSSEANATDQSKEPVFLFGKLNKDDEFELDPWGNKPVPVDPAWYKEDCSDSDSDDIHEIVIRARLRSPIEPDTDSDDESDSDESDSESGDDDSDSEDSDEDVKVDDGLEPDLRHLITEVINESIHELVEEPDCTLLLSDDEEQGVIIVELSPEDEENEALCTDVTKDEDEKTIALEDDSKKKTGNRNNSNSNGEGTGELKEVTEGVGKLPDVPVIKAEENCPTTSEDHSVSSTSQADAAPATNTGGNAELDVTAEKSEGIEILLNMTDDNAMAIDTIVARAADNEEIDSALALPELDVEDVIDLLQGSALHAASKLHIENRTIFAESGPQPRRNMGDNTVVVASTNRLGLPLDTPAIYQTLPEIQTKIDSTHTVASVTGPISSPGAPRSARKYRSIYATLPADDSIEIETQVVPERDNEDFMSSFTKLDLGTVAAVSESDGRDSGESVQGPLTNDHLLPGQTPIFHSSDPVGRNSFTASSAQLTSLHKNPFSVVKSAPKVHSRIMVSQKAAPAVGVTKVLSSPQETKPVEPVCRTGNTISPSDRNSSPAITSGVTVHASNQGRIKSIETPRVLNLMSPSSERSSSIPGGGSFSPSLVFKERNFSPILEVKFPHSPPISIPCVQPQLDPARKVNRETKRKQPCAESVRPEAHILEVSKKNLHSPKNKSGAARRPGMPRTPPKKVIGQPNVHKFNTHLSSSRSLFHKHCVHTSPRPKAKASVHHINHNVPKSEPRLKTKPPTATKTPTHHKKHLVAKPKTPSSVPRMTTSAPAWGRNTQSGKTTHTRSVSMKHKWSPTSNHKARAHSKTTGPPSKYSAGPRSLTKTFTDAAPFEKVRAKPSPKPSPSPRYTLTPVNIGTVSQQKSSSGGKPRAVLGRRTPGSEPLDLQDFVNCEALAESSGRIGDGDGPHRDQFLIDDTNVSSSRRKRAADRVGLMDSFNVGSPLTSELLNDGGGAGDSLFVGSSPRIGNTFFKI